MQIRIEGSDLPGRRGGAEADALRRGNVHVGVQRRAGAGLRRRGTVDVGVQRRAEVVDRFPADAARATWEFEVAGREVDGLLDVGGPYVHGRPGARFLYLSWGAVDGETFAVFRRAKLLFGDVPTEVLRAAYEGAGPLVGQLGLTGADGGPRCARVRPPDIAWQVG
ncbi:DUF5990 family protein [Actinoplanes sp. NPDC049316]|uniref:DUF5990 family protein n=1 Tax=Actinoplanes sp. NPDC049316 TaxID=3154727 RepID=UPI003424344C